MNMNDGRHPVQRIGLGVLLLIGASKQGQVAKLGIMVHVSVIVCFEYQHSMHHFGLTLKSCLDVWC